MYATGGCRWVILVSATAVSQPACRCRSCWAVLLTPLPPQDVSLIACHIRVSTDKSNLPACWQHSVYPMSPSWQEGQRADCCSAAGVVARKCFWGFVCVLCPRCCSILCLSVAGGKSRRLHWPHQLHDRPSHRVQEETVSSLSHSVSFNGSFQSGTFSEGATCQWFELKSSSPTSKKKKNTDRKCLITHRSQPHSF